MFSAHARTARKPTTHTHTQFDPNSEVYVQTEFPEDEYAAAEAARQQDEASTVSEDFLRQMDGKGSGGPRAPRRPTGPDGRSTNTGVKGVQADYAAAKLKLRARRLEAKLYAERALNRASVGADRNWGPQQSCSAAVWSPATSAHRGPREAPHRPAAAQLAVARIPGQARTIACRERSRSGAC